MSDRPRRSGSTRVDSSAGESGPGRTDGFRLQRGQSVHRYVVLYELGAGGMGIVYAAYDPELDRKVALKLLHGDRTGSRGRTRLLREAKAIAKLTHPNVVTVHDVGTYDGRVFVAMEFVDGITFRRWVQKGQRSWRETIAVLRDAGKGLAAAHAADLVHRDFKPDNVIVDNAGRIVVLDFGLARRATTHGDDPPERAASSIPLGIDELAIDLTKTGAKLGTPAYMAPEQHMSSPTDARTDQFAFCVVAWEALYGSRPFRGGTQAATAMQVVKGEVAEPPKGVDVPSFLRRELTRGLAVEPNDRHPNMDALLEALAHDPRTALRKRLVLGASALGAVAITALGYRAFASTPPVCEASAERWAGVWDDSQRSQVQAAFQATQIAYAGTAWVGVEAALDAYMRDWVLVHREACEATHVHHEQSEDMLDLRMGCLRSRRDDAGALVAEFANADAAVVQNAVEAAAALPRLDGCSDADRLASRLEPPADERTRARVEYLRQQLSDAKAKESAGRYESALSSARNVLLGAQELDYAPLAAEAQLRLGSVLERTGDYGGSERQLLEGIWTAEASHHLEVAAQAWVRLVWVTGVELVATEQGQLWGRFARAALQRIGKNELLDAQLTHNLGGVLYREGKLDDALAYYQRALKVQTSVLGADDPSVAMTLNHIGNTLMEQRRLDDAREYCDRSLELRRRILGERHPKVAASLNNIGELLRKKGDPRGSLEFAERSLVIAGGTAGPEEAVALVLAGAALLKLKRFGDAATHYQRLAEVREKTRGADDPAVSSALRQLATAREGQGRPADALAILERSVRLDRTERPETAAEALMRIAALHETLSSPADAQRAVDLAHELTAKMSPDANKSASNALGRP